MTSLNSILAIKINKVKSKKQNGFTLIELMVVVAIVGVLTAVGLPELSKAQDKAKDSAAIATLTNAAKECSLSLILNGDDSDFTAANFSIGENDIGGTEGCALDGDLSLTSEAENTFVVDFTGSVPGAVEEG